MVGADVNGLITRWSEGAERLFGHDESEAVGQSPEFIVPEHLREAHREGFRGAMRNPLVQDVTPDIPVLCADGQVREYPVRLLVLGDALGTVPRGLSPVREALESACSALVTPAAFVPSNPLVR